MRIHPENPFRLLNRLDYLIWGSSVLIVCASFLLFSGAGVLPLIASLIGVTALIYMAKGHPYGQLLTIVFSLFYGVISFFFRYYGEMLTYLGMTLPMAALSLCTWLRNPYGKSQIVKIRQRLSMKLIVWMILLTAAATAGFIIPEHHAALTVLRPAFILAAAAAGLPAIALLGTAVLFHICGTEIFGYPVSAPVAPLLPNRLQDIFARIGFRRLSQGNFRVSEVRDR